jgi:AmmeMemoRadiSam system protein B
LLFFHIHGQETRPIRDNIGYCWNTEAFNQLINFIRSDTTDPPNAKKMIAGISPHDDYLYAARAYYFLFKNIKVKEVVIFGVTHSTVRKVIGDPQGKLIFDEHNFWSGLTKNIPVSALREFLKENMPGEYIMTSNLAHQLEHSIEATLPFLQYFNPDVTITPIMVTGMPFTHMELISDEISRLITAYIRQNHLQLGKDIFFLISSDANHYGPDFGNTCYGQDNRAHKMATQQDKTIARTYLSGNITRQKVHDLTQYLWGKTYRDFESTLWCGKYSIPFGMLTILKILKNNKKSNIFSGKILYHSDTYSSGVLPVKNSGLGITAPFSVEHWVGFFSAGFYIE